MFFKKLFFLLCVLILSGRNGAQTIETISLKLNRADAQNIETPGVLLKNWELYLIENPNSIIGTTKSVLIRNSFNPADSLDLTASKGVCWFRKVFKPDSTFRNKAASLEVMIEGACEIFVNKKRVMMLGIVSADKNGEKIILSEEERMSVKFEEGKTYEILVRYSNHELNSAYTIVNKFGFNIFIKETDQMYSNLIAQKLTGVGLSLVLIVFFITLCLVHFMIYLHNKNEPANLYYSGFCFFVSLLIASLMLENLLSNYTALMLLSVLTLVSPVMIFIILPVMLRSFFNMERPKWYKWVLLSGAFCVLGFMFHLDFSSYLLVGIIIFGSAEALRIFAIAFRQKKTGVKIIGTGLLFFLVMVVLLLVSAIIGGNFTTQNLWLGLLLIFFFILCVVSIPISITIFLARNIALTNKSLAKKLKEVEELSEKTIAQEKEKQSILENQKTLLEEQVKERTYEITEQKKTIEQKNKDIIDSIHYAKRIQQSLLPMEKFLEKVLNRLKS